MCTVLLIAPRYTAFPKGQAQIPGEHGRAGILLPQNYLVLVHCPVLRAAPRPKPAAQLRKCRNPETGLNGEFPPSLPRGFTRDQSFNISLLLLVDPEVTDIERRAMETSL